MIFEFRIIQIANRIVKIRGSGCSASRGLSGGSFFHPPTPGLPLSFTRPLISPNFLRFVGGESSGTKGCHLLTCANSSASRDASPHEDVFEVERTEASRSGSVFHDSPSDVSKFHGTQGFLQCSSSYFKAFQTQRAQDVVDLGKERHVDHVLERLISGICGTVCVSWISTGGST